MVELKAAPYFLNKTSTFGEEEIESFTKHVLANKRKHTSSDLEHVTNLLKDMYNAH